MHEQTQTENFATFYREWRRQYYDQFPTFWGTNPGEPVEEYAVFGALEMPHEHASMLRQASERLYSLMTRLAQVVQQADYQFLLDMGIPEPTIPYVAISIPEMPAVMCGRFEYAMTADGPKLLEFNAETPTFVVELFHMNSKVCADFGLNDPNSGCQQELVQALRQSITTALTWVGTPSGRTPRVVFSAYSNRKEERGTTEFYRSLLEASGPLPYETSFCGLADLRVTEDGLQDAAGEPIDVLYKLYPTEHLMEDESPEGAPVGLSLMELVRKKLLAVINPPVAFLLQNKALGAVLWAMHLARSELFTPEEHAWIAQYILPTYLQSVDEDGQPLFTGRYVRKPVYGREGGSISILDNQYTRSEDLTNTRSEWLASVATGSHDALAIPNTRSEWLASVATGSHDSFSQTIVEQSAEDLYRDQVMVYQQYVPLATTRLQTEKGLVEVNLVHNCFVVDGLASAVGVRAAQRLIFDDSSYFWPTCYPAEHLHNTSNAEIS